jgi:hypothetical protein
MHQAQVIAVFYDIPVTLTNLDDYKIGQNLPNNKALLI